MLCVASSLLFGLVWHVTYGTWLSAPFGLLMPVSMLYHAGMPYAYAGKRLIAIVDKSLSSYVTLRGAYEAIMLPFSLYVVMFWCGFWYMVWVYYIAKKSHCPTWGKVWHSTLHVGAMIAAIGLFWSY